MDISIVLRFCPVEQIRFRRQPIEVRADQTAGSIPQHKVEEESRRQPFQLGDKKDPRAAVRKHVQGDFPGKFHRHVESVYRGRQTELMERLALFVDQNYGLIVVGVLNVQGLTRFLGAEIAASWHEKVRSEEHTSELQSRGHLVCRLLLEKK